MYRSARTCLQSQSASQPKVSLFSHCKHAEPANKCAPLHSMRTQCQQRLRLRHTHTHTIVTRQTDGRTDALERHDCSLIGRLERDLRLTQTKPMRLAGGFPLELPVRRAIVSACCGLHLRPIMGAKHATATRLSDRAGRRRSSSWRKRKHYELELARSFAHNRTRWRAHELNAARTKSYTRAHKDLPKTAGPLKATQRD